MISIIVPIYKAESFLSRCVDSILTQTFQDWELLLIDDGSPDKSGEICEEYAQKESRIRVFHKPNGGVSSARNLGLDNAKGEWVTFVDSDDYILPQFLERLLKNSKGDLVISGSKRFGASNDSYLIPVNKVFYVGELVRYMFLGQSKEASREYLSSISYPWGKLLKLNVIRDNRIRFNEKMKLSEDTCFMMQYIECVERVCFIKGGDYMYFISNGTKSHLRMTAEEYNEHCIIMNDTANHLGLQFSQSPSRYINGMCSMYFSAFLSCISTLNYSDFQKQITAFRNYNNVPYKKLLVGQSSKRRALLLVAMHIDLFLFIVLKTF